MLAVIDYGAGNLRSVLHALKHLQAEDVQLVQVPSQLEGAEKIVAGIYKHNNGLISSELFNKKYLANEYI